MKQSWKWILSMILLMALHFRFTFCNSRTIIPQETCRISGGRHLPPDVFADYACATCYKHMAASLFENGTKLEWHETCLYNRSAGECYKPTYDNESSPIFRTFPSKRVKHFWTDCCRAAIECCQVMRKTQPALDTNICPRTWDGWKCWEDTPSGTTTLKACPLYIYFHTDTPRCSRYATKQCLENGTWYLNQKGNEFSDYTTCGRNQEIKILLNTHILTFGISAVLLLPAIGIFFYFRQLKGHRIFMHKNLFTSLVFTAILVIIFESHFMMDYISNPSGSIVERNSAGCKVFYTLTKYMRLTNYAWMFCEGFYLHRLIVAAFAEQKSTLVFHIVGWGLPVIPVTIWAIVRKIYDDELCWTDPSDGIQWILLTPMLVALVVNFCFLAHIIQVLITKLRSSNADEPTQFRRAVRATIVLIPLFGLHFLLVSYHPGTKDCYVKQIYNIVTYSMDGLQGGIVSIIFCYLNKEVLSLLKLSYSRQKMVRNVGSHANNSRRTRESRTSMSTNVDSFATDCNAIVRTMKK